MTRNTTCPNCGEEADVILKPNENRPEDITNYDRFCHIGTLHEEYPGYHFYHGVSQA